MTEISPLTDASWPARDGHRLALWAGEIAFFTRLAQAIAGARRRIWIGVSFVWRGFRLPDGRLWWEALDDAAVRGVDVRLLFWRNPDFFSQVNIFQGDPADRAWLRARGARYRIRWDSSGAHPAHCHHQKFWLIDPGEPDALAFVGGMVKTRRDLAERARSGRPEGRHDVTLELQGPAVADVAANFVERWNTPGADPGSLGPWPDAESAGPLAPIAPPPPAGSSRVQILRTLQPGRYGRTRGEDDIARMYLAALNEAERAIYIENQHPGEERMLAEIAGALRRGAQVLYVVPAEPMAAIFREKARARQAPGPTRYSAVFEQLAGLAAHPGFTLAALARPAPDNALEEIYAHAKVAVVDDTWATVGSANLVDLSMAPDHTELNAALWGPAAAGIAGALLAMHLERAPPDGPLEDRIRLASAVARENARRRARGEAMVGALYALDPVTYADAPGEIALWRG